MREPRDRTRLSEDWLDNLVRGSRMPSFLKCQKARILLKTASRCLYLEGLLTLSLEQRAASRREPIYSIRAPRQPRTLTVLSLTQRLRDNLKTLSGLSHSSRYPCKLSKSLKLKMPFQFSSTEPELNLSIVRVTTALTMNSAAPQRDKLSTWANKILTLSKTRLRT